LRKRGWHQKPHWRTSVRGIKFPAGQGKNKNYHSRGRYAPYPSFVSKKQTLLKKAEKLIKNNPKLAKKILENIALWGGCTLMPEICPIFQGVYHLYIGEKTIFNLFDSDLKSSDFKDFDLFQKIFQGKLSKDEINEIFPTKVIILARKAEYANHLINKLKEFKISPEKEIYLTKSLLNITLKIDYIYFLSVDERNDNSLRITASFQIDKNKLFNEFEKTLKVNNINLYKELLIHIIGEMEI